MSIGNAKLEDLRDPVETRVPRHLILCKSITFLNVSGKHVEVLIDEILWGTSPDPLFVVNFLSAKWT